MAEIDNLIAEVNKKYKTDIIRKASDLKGIEFNQRRSTCREDHRASRIASEW